MGRGNIFKLTNKDTELLEEQRKEALRLYCEAAAPDLQAIAEVIGVGPRTVQKWVHRYGWLKERDAARVPIANSFIERNGELIDRTSESLDIASTMKKALSTRVNDNRDVLAGSEIAQFANALSTLDKLEHRAYSAFGIEPRALKKKG